MVPAGSLVWIVLGAALVGVGSRVAIPPFTWVALILLLHASRSASAWRAAPWIFLGSYVAVLVSNRGILPVSGPAYFAIGGFFALTATAPFVLDRLVPRGSDGLVSTLVFPMAFVAVEFLRSRFAPGATWGSIAYTQYGNLPLMQAAAFTGIAGITFLMAWFASTFEMAWARGFDWTDVRTPVMTCGIVVGAVLVGGSVRLAFAPTGRATIRIAIVNRPPDLFFPGEMTRVTEGGILPAEHNYIAGKLARLHDWFLHSSRREARAGARLIVWPEQNLLVFKENERNFLGRAQQLAASEHTYLAMGMGTIHLGEKLPFENKLVLIDPSGNIILTYRKTHPVMGWEAGIMQPGDGRLPVVSTREGRIATAICYDADFPEFIRQAGRQSADVLILPANDWKQIKHLHAQMAAFRAVENGVPLVRAAASGVSGAFDPWGRLLGQADYFAPGDRTLTAQVPLGGVPTLYSRTGDLFAWLCVAGLVLALGSAAMNVRRPAASASSDGLLVASLTARPHSRPRRGRAAVLFQLLIVVAACILAGMGIRFAIQETAAYLNRTVQQQFVRGSQIPVGQSVQREARKESDSWRPSATIARM
jgi:apolipoprotein N-acyltransferase